jgi:proline iminopeptidase
MRVPRAGRVAAVVLVGLIAAEAAVAQGAGDGPLAPGAHEAVVNGVRLWYRVGGEPSGGVPPVVFLHGGPGQGSVHLYALAGPHLEERLQMVYLDQRGSGRSERPWTGDYAIGTLVEDIEGLRRHLGVPQIAVVGQSFGGTLALEYAAAYPERVSHLVFVAGLWDVDLQCRLRAERLAELRPEAYARVRADTLRADGTRRSDCELEFGAFESMEEREAYNLEIMYPDSALAARMDSVEVAHGVRNTGEMGRALFGSGLLEYRFTELDRLTMPALVMAGRHDGAARPEGLRALADRLPDARYLEYEGSGHFVYLDEPERFARDLAAFLRIPPREG